MTIPRFYAPPAVAPGDERLTAAAALRNREPILAVLRTVLPSAGTVLEIGSGTGEHVTLFAGELPGLVFQPSDRAEAFRRSVSAWTAHLGLSNVRAPIDLDVFAAPWPVPAADAVVASNMIHVAPIEALTALLRGASRVLAPGGPLVLYGPFRIHGVHVAETNVAFDASLRAEDPAWGVRDVDDVSAAAAPVAMRVTEVIEMPANNRVVVVRGTG